MSILSNFKLDLEQAEVDIIGKALGQLPFSVVAPLVNKLNAQLAAQQGAPTPTPTVETVVPDAPVVPQNV